MSEIEPFPRRVLMMRQRAEDVRYPRKGTGPVLWGDFTSIKMRYIERTGIQLPDILVAGTPCQAFSIAGLRKSLDDDRGNLTLAFVRLANAIDNVRTRRGLQPIAIVWENVPGVLSVPDNAFGCFLGALVGADSPLVSPTGIGWTDAGLVSGPRRSVAWIKKDAQFFGLAQRRERVFLVASAGDVSYPAEILLNEQSLPGNYPPSRETGEGFTHDAAPSLTRSGRGVERAGDSRGQDPVIAVQLPAPSVHVPQPEVDSEQTLNPAADSLPATVGTISDGAHFGGGGKTDRTRTAGELSIAHCLTKRGEKGGDPTTDTYIACIRGNNTSGPIEIATAVNASQTASGRLDFESETFIVGPDRAYVASVRESSGGSSRSYVVPDMAVRRLTVVEVARLQGFDDLYCHIETNSRRKIEADDAEYLAGHGLNVWQDSYGQWFTNIAADGPMYRAYGNSMAVPVIRWIGKRIKDVLENRK